ncbi:MAG: heme ABC transporter ATP-binding protein [Mangrovicoccus sp.]
MELIATDISLSFGKRQILHNAAFRAKAGQVSVIVGPNGSGKTTLLRAMTGELSHKGQVLINGEDCAALRPVELAMRRAVLPQAAALSFPFTVLEVIRLGLTAGLATHDPKAQAELPLAALARVDLAGFENRFYQDLSGGEKQRVQLARVLVQIWEPVLNGAPRWLFLDEPISALDIAHQLTVMRIARDFADAGGGVVAVLHDLNLTAMFADHVSLIEDGHIRANGPPGEVLTNAQLSAAYHCPLRINTAPPSGQIWLLPQAVEPFTATPVAGMFSEKGTGL